MNLTELCDSWRGWLHLWNLGSALVAARPGAVAYLKMCRLLQVFKNRVMSLIKNSFYNLAGFAIPTLIAVPALGYLARVIGVEAFGIFTLAFAIVGYASIFDAGLSRAVIREISIYRDDLQEQYKIIATSGIVVLFMGCTAAILLLLSVPHLNSF
ncbi:oligosaccharide flippase family protein [Citrobacter freundii]|uniref:oligosaccharide flippase family protein n=1 Tax=Citrobacter freundii TaxID=546 RepID=UPI002E1620E1|nr:oligosaccharide flippase family protein [Citrobacter freundii]